MITDEQLAEYNDIVKNMSAIELIQWSKREFGDDLYAMSSFGVDSCMMLELVKQADIKIPVIMIDTGFLFSKTHAFKDQMKRKYDLDIETCYPSQQSIDYIKEVRLWETHTGLYYDIVKLEPLSRIIQEKGVRALLSGIRGDQTKNRATKERISRGNDGELRIHPVINWTQGEVDAFFEKYKLPRHPMFYEGYASVGDWTTTTKGSTRDESRKLMNEKMECGIHVSTNTNPPTDAKEANRE